MITTYLETLERGDRVTLEPATIWGEPVKKYFVLAVGDSVLLADSKKEAINDGKGYLYFADCIRIPKDFTEQREAKQEQPKRETQTEKFLKRWKI